MSNIVVRYLQGDRLMAEVRGHEVAADQPAADGGEDLAPTPTELFLTGLATRRLGQVCLPLALDVAAPRCTPSAR
jgi:hypothetical protein